MDRLAEYLEQYNSEIQESFNRFVVDSFNLDENFVEPQKPTVNNIFMSNDKLFFDIKIDVAVRKQKIDRNSILNTTFHKNCYMQCTLDLDDDIKNFRILSVDDEPHNNRNFDKPVEVNANLIPRDKRYPMQIEAEELIKEYFTQDEIDNFTFIPIRELIKRMGLTIIEDYCITPNCTSQARVSMVDESIILYEPDSGKEIKKKLKAGTILLDAKYVKNSNEKAINFSLAHEVYHWLRHRYFVILREKVAPSIGYHLICNIDNSYFWRDENRNVEVQANKFAGSILLCHRDLVVRFNNKLLQYMYYYAKDKQKVVDRILQELSDYYRVSAMTLAIRLTAVGTYLPEFENHKYDFKNKNPHYEISFEDLVNLCVENDEFRKLIFERKLIYSKKKVVVNSEKFLKNGKIITDNNVGCIKFQYRYVGNNKIQCFALCQSKLKQVPTVEDSDNKEVLKETQLVKLIDNSILLNETKSMNLKDLLTKFRKDRGLIQQNMADYLVVDLRTYQRYENMEEPMPEDVALKIIHKLKMQHPYGEIFLTQAGHSIKNTKRGMAIATVITSGFSQPIDTWIKIINQYENK